MEDHAVNLVKTLLCFQKRGLFCDTVFVTKNRPLFAHSAILASTCPVMFNLLNQRPTCSQSTMTIQLEQLDSKLVEDFLEFLYTGRTDESCVVELNEVCHLFGITLNFETLKFGTKSMDCDLLAKSNADTNDVTSDVGAEIVGRELRGTVGKNNVEQLYVESVPTCDMLEDRVLSVTNESQNCVLNKKQIGGAEARFGFFSTDCRSGVVGKTMVDEHRTVNKGVVLQRVHQPVAGFQCPVQNTLQGDTSARLSIYETHNVKSAATVELTHASAPAECIGSSHQCFLCEASFRTERALNIHKYSHNVMADGNYQCHVCSKIFKVREYLRKHLRGHYGKRRTRQAKKYFCQSCQKCFRTAARLELHVNTHTGRKPFTCVVCGKRYADKEYLVKHQRLHRGEKPYLCDDCGLGFSFRQSYTSHRKLHTGEKPYVCSECNHAFGQSSALRTHLRIHCHPSISTCVVNHELAKDFIGSRLGRNS